MVRENSTDDNSSDNIFQELIQALSELTVEVRNLQEEHHRSRVELNVLTSAVKDLRTELSTVQPIVAETISNNTDQQETVDNPTAVEEPVADPVVPPHHPLRIGDTVRITSTNRFGTVGTILRFTRQRVVLDVRGVFHPVLRSFNNIEHIGEPPQPEQ